MNKVVQQNSPFHTGEQAVQERLGVRDIEEWARKVVRPFFTKEHKQFHTALPFLVVAARDKKNRPWVTLLVGSEGFVGSPDPRTLDIKANVVPGDALVGSLETGSDLGILGIELATRRRNRVNGRISQKNEDDLIFSVDQAYGNCPQYIREREWRRVDSKPTGPVIRDVRLSRSQRKWIETADTFFIASGYRGEGESPSFGMDASHRGGDRGFVQVVNDRCLRFPDYAGNNHYNTMGNLMLDSRAGYLFVDFTTGSLLQLTGQATIDWDSAEINKYPGARRLVTFNIEEIVELPAAVPLRWEENAESVRSLRVIDKNRESEDVTSFLFEARDGGPLQSFQAGQHLPIVLKIPGIDRDVSRTYSLSGSPTDNTYRISVKREPHGLVSRHLHDNIEIGAILDSRIPAGEFGLPRGKCPIVLVSAGVGVTPMISMLHTIIKEQHKRPVWFIHGARNRHYHPFAEELRDLVEERAEIHLNIVYSQPGLEDKLSEKFISHGRVDGALINTLVGQNDVHYMLCGPLKFMAKIQTDLEQLGVSSERIHTESFGPVG